MFGSAILAVNRSVDVLTSGRARRSSAVRSFGLDGLDLAVARYLRQGPGVFVEAGAHDGLTQSNTAMLELSRGWSGLLVEPIPELASLCRDNRPGSVVEQVALVAADYEGDEIDMTYCNRSSIVDGGRGSAPADTAWVERCRHLPDQADVEPYRLRVPTRTLSALLDAHRIGRVDFLSLDLEGYESSALRGLDLERHRPELLLVEISRDPEATEALLDPWYLHVADLSDHRDHDPPWHDALYRAR
jgi:FkbM family methyltransferase